MRSRRTRFLIVLAALLVPFVLGSGPAQALNFADDNCAANPLVVDTLAVAQTLANGYNCPLVDVTIKTTLPNIVDPILSITAKTLKVIGPDVLDPAKRVQIINNVANSDVNLTTTGDMSFSEASVMAHHRLKLECKGSVPTLCNITGDLSDMIAAPNFTPPFGFTGDLHIRAKGNIKFTGSTIHGGAHWENFAGGSITVLCVPGVGGCKDPLLAPFVVNTLCGNPPVFPCTVTFNTPADLRAVCIQAPGVTCNGGSVEKRFHAVGDIDITGSKIDSIEHITFETDQGNIKAAGAIITSTADNIIMRAPLGTIDISGATLTAKLNVLVAIDGTCPVAPPGVCINAREADIDGKDIVIRAKAAGGAKGVIDLCGATLNDDGADFPNLNGDSTPPYSDPSVLDDAAECPAPPGPATIS